MTRQKVRVALWRIVTERRLDGRLGRSPRPVALLALAGARLVAGGERCSVSRIAADPSTNLEALDDRAHGQRLSISDACAEVLRQRGDDPRWADGGPIGLDVARSVVVAESERLNIDAGVDLVPPLLLKIEIDGG